MRKGQAVNALSALLGSDTLSNAACCGYMLLACKNIGHSEKERRNLLDAVQASFGNFTKQQA